MLKWIAWAWMVGRLCQERLVMIRIPIPVKMHGTISVNVLVRVGIGRSTGVRLVECVREM